MARGGETLKDRAMDFIRAAGIVQARELSEAGVPTAILRRLHEDGLVVNPARGVYMLPEYETEPLADYAIEAVSAPSYAPISLVTAAYLQQLITRDPRQMWLTLHPGAWSPRTAGRLPVLSISSRDFSRDGYLIPPPGHRAHVKRRFAGRSLLLTSPARTVVDIFVHLKRFGEETAVEALGSALANGVAPSEIEAFAEQAGAARRIGPYLAGAGAGLNRMY